MITASYDEKQPGSFSGRGRVKKLQSTHERSCAKRVQLDGDTPLVPLHGFPPTAVDYCTRFTSYDRNHRFFVVEYTWMGSKSFACTLQNSPRPVSSPSKPRDDSRGGGAYAVHDKLINTRPDEKNSTLLFLDDP